MRDSWLVSANQTISHTLFACGWLTQRRIAPRAQDDRLPIRLYAIGVVEKMDAVDCM
jgi:hypothetical protein